MVLVFSSQTFDYTSTPSDMIRINNTQYFHFLEQADALRRSGSLCDAIISVKSQTFRAHRLVLACASRTLAQQLARGDIDSPVRCTLEYFSPHTFQQVLDFTYTQALEVSVDDLQLLLKAAQLLEMQPLEDQCRKQLDTLDCRAEKQEKRDKTTDVKVEKETPEGQNQHPNASPFNEDKLLKRSFPGNEAGTALENLSPSTPTKTHSSPSPPRKKAKLSPISEPIHSRNSAVAKPASSNSSFSYPWTFSTNMWDSVSTLRRIAENYPSLLAAHPLQSPNQSSIPYPYSLSSPQMFPLLSSHFQTPGQNPIMGYSGFHPRYAQNIYTGPTRMGNIIKQSLLKRKRSSQKAFPGTVQPGEPR